MRRVDADDVHARLHQRRGALLAVGTNADRRTDTQAPAVVTASVRELAELLDVLDRDEAEQPARVVDHEQLLDPVLVQDVLRLVERHARARRHQISTGHDLAHRPIEMTLEAQVAVRQDSDQPASPGDRHAGDARSTHDLECRRDGLVRVDRERVGHHAALELLHPGDLGRLALDRQVLVDEADAARLRHRDGRLRLRDRVHRRTHQRDVERDPPREPARHVGRSRQHVGGRWHQEDVVEGQALGQPVQLHQDLPAGAAAGPRAAPQGASAWCGVASSCSGMGRGRTMRPSIKAQYMGQDTAPPTTGCGGGATP